MNLKNLFRRPERRGKTSLMKQLEEAGINLAEDDTPGDFTEEDFYDRKNYAFTKKGERHYEGFTETDSYLISYEGDETHVVIREGIAVIGNTAFAKNHNIISVHLPESLKVIEEEAFRECEKLEKINIPDGVEFIGEGAFKGCSGFENINIPSHIKTIEKYAFMGCVGIYEIEIPESIEKLGPAAFWGCEGLSEARLPESLRAVPDFLFYGCGMLYRVKLSSGTVKIGDFSFADCYCLTDIEIPENVTFGPGAFCNCYNLIDENGLLIRGGTLLFCSAYVDCVTIPDGVKNLDSEAFNGCTGLNWLIIPDSVKEIIGGEGRMYTGFSNLKAGDIVSRYPYIFGANDLEKVILSEKTTGIAEGAFAMNNMEEIVIPAGVKFIGRGAFESCVSLKKVVFKGDAPKIEKDAFDKVEAVMYYPEGNSAWTRKVFSDFGGCLTWKPYKEGGF